MKHSLAAALLLFAACAAQAQDEGIERERIAAERAVVEARFAERSRACNARFAVTDCVDVAKRERNAALADLRRQEQALKDAGRSQRAADRLRAQEERNAPERLREAEARRARAIAGQQEREARAAEQARQRTEGSAAQGGVVQQVRPLPEPPQPQGKPRAGRAPGTPALTAEEAASNRAAFEARIRAAEAHKAEVRERAARRDKSPAAGLPVPE